MPSIKETIENPTQVATKPETESVNDAKDSKKPEYDKDELLRIFDEMIFSSEYQEDITIKKKLKVTFRTRSADDITKISRDVESQNFTLLSTLTEYRALVNMSYSVVKYSGKDLSTLSPQDRYKFIVALPAPLITLISDALVKFDMKIAEACQEGEANF